MQGVEKFMKPIFGIPKEEEYSKEEVNLGHVLMRKGLGVVNMNRYRENAIEIARETFEVWSKKKEKFNLLEAWADLVNTINVRNFMGEECCKLYASEFCKNIEDLEKHGTSPLALMMPSLPTPDILKCNAAKRKLNAIISEQLAKRRDPKLKDVQDDFLQLYAEARRSDGSFLDSDLVLNCMIAIFFGAFHNTTNTLTWLSATLFDPLNKSHLDRVRQEVVSTNESDKEGHKSVYLDQCMKEISRLYFTVMVPPRKVVVPFTVESQHQASSTTKSYTIPEGAYVCVAPIVTHRDSKVFDRPLEFDPTRFAPEQSRQYEKAMQFVQFGFGKHRCTGEHYAIELVQCCMKLLLSRYDLKLYEEIPAPLFHKPIGTAIPTKPIWASLVPRG
eukprot:TRINITY_DN9489_c0_g1_i1.p1 TRINITY_DN9489_c0_g1~~TRINITY_DN9489_c0_g1_i1.p1  ORF type:complete len:388 (+),score=99.24 TRINITY_DN9489_c0_g1_i1:41-1204(+)